MRTYSAWLLALLVAMSEIPDLHAEDGKKDVLDLITGMTVAEINKIVTAKKWNCRKDISPMAGPMPYTCDTNLGQINLNFAPSLEGNPLFKVRLFFQSAESLQDVVKSISNQYGKAPSETKADFRWQLGSQVLRLEKGSNYMLDLVNPSLAEQNDRRAREIELQKNPTPKF